MSQTRVNYMHVLSQHESWKVGIFRTQVITGWVPISIAGVFLTLRHTTSYCQLLIRFPGSPSHCPNGFCYSGVVFLPQQCIAHNKNTKQHLLWHRFIYLEDFYPSLQSKTKNPLNSLQVPSSRPVSFSCLLCNVPALPIFVLVQQPFTIRTLPSMPNIISWCLMVASFICFYYMKQSI